MKIISNYLGRSESERKGEANEAGNRKGKIASKKKEASVTPLGHRDSARSSVANLILENRRGVV